MQLTAVYIAVPEGYIAFVEELPGANIQGVQCPRKAVALHAKLGRGRDMRTVFVAVAVCFACLVGSHSGHAEDKKEKERREQLEKDLARIEPALEKEEWAVKRKQFIADLAKHLEKADRIDLFRLNSRALHEADKEKKEFHGYEILSEISVEPVEKRKEIAAFLGNTFHWSELRKAVCYNPRHGLRAVSGKRTLDFVICFECNRVRVFDGGKQLAELPMAGLTDQKNAIERFLPESEKKSDGNK